MSTILVNKTIGPVPVSVVLKEKHEHALGITTDPIESGAEINDHAYLKQKRITLDFADGNAAATFNALVAFQASRVPTSIVTGLFVYPNMLIERLIADRDETTGRICSGSAECSEIIIVSTAYASPDSPELDQAGGSAGGANSTKAARPSSSLAQPGDTATTARASGTLQRGDIPTTTVPSTTTTNQSMLKRLLG
jgi:hypothetical protein